MRASRCLVALMAFAAATAASAADFSVTDRTTGYTLSFDIIRNGDGAHTKTTLAKVVATPEQQNIRFEDITVKVPRTVRHGNVDYLVTEIGDKAFYEVDGVVAISLPSSIDRIGNFAFSGCSDLTSFILPASVTTAGSGNGSSSLGNHVFDGCGALRKLGFAQGTEVVDFLPWEQCDALVAVEIPESVKVIRNLDKLYNLKSVDVDSGNSAFFSNGGMVFAGAPDGKRRTLFKVPCGTQGEIEVPASTTDIDPGAFRGCTRITGIRIPESIVSLRDINMFRDMESLENLHIGVKGKISPNATNSRNKEVLLLLFSPKTECTVYASGKTRGIIATKEGPYRVKEAGRGNASGLSGADGASGASAVIPAIDIKAEQLPVAVETVK